MFFFYRLIPRKSPFSSVGVKTLAPNDIIASSIAKEAGAHCEVSLERRMACGLGACLSCSIDTVDGRKKVCKDGPVFDAARLKWD